MKNKFNLKNYKNIFIIRKKNKIGTLIFLFLIIFSQKRIFSDYSINKYQIEKKTIRWEKIIKGEEKENDIIWQKIKIKKDDISPIKEVKKYKDLSNNSYNVINSFNRSIVFNDSIVGPDISWLVPPGFKWNKKYKFDASIRGHSGRFEKGRNGKSFWGWNNGDAVGLFYYQFLNNERNSFGLNYGIRSI